MVGNKFCPECGRETDELVNSLCRNCHFKGKQFIQVPEKLEGQVCRNCSKIYRKGSWQPLKEKQEEAVYEAAYRSVEKELKINPLDEYRVEIQPGIMKKSSETVFLVPMEVQLTGKDRGMEYQESQQVEVRVILSLCPYCTRESSRYFEAILQVRGEEKLDDDFLGEIDNYVRELLDSMKDEKNAFISDFKLLKGGLDYYMGSNRIAAKISIQLINRYGGAMGESPKLVGRKEGRDMYRVSYSVRISALREGDIFVYNKRLFQAVRIMGKRLRVFGLVERKFSSIDIKDFDKNSIRARKKDYFKGMVLESIPGRVQMMDSKEYKTFYLDTNLPLKVQEEYDIIRIDKREYLLLTQLDRE